MILSHRAVVLLAIFFGMCVLGVLGYIGYQAFFGKQKNEIPQGALYTPDTLSVEFADGYFPAEPGVNPKWDELYPRLQKMGVVGYEKVFRSDDPTLARFYTLKLKKGSDIKAIRDELYTLKEVKSSDPEYIISTQATANDPSYPTMWDLAKIDIEHAWDISKGANNVIVAVIDTGIDYTHADFAGRSIIKGKDYSTCNNTTAELTASNGECTKPKSPDDDPMDGLGHGTHVAGTIGAATNNGVGISGVNWNVGFMAIKILGDGGAGDLTAAARGIEDAQNAGAKIINLSLGGRGSCTSTLQAAINAAVSSGMVIVAAAGNDNTAVSSFSPANCNNVIAVGASNIDDKRAYYSNYGSSVTLAAPGGDKSSDGSGVCSPSNCIYSLWKNGEYKATQGTSMASPHVAGVAALLLAKNPGMTPEEIKKCLVDTGDPISTDQDIGGKRLNANKALQTCKSDANPTITTHPAPSGAPSGDTRRIEGKVFVDSNNNREIDQGELGLAGSLLVMTGRDSQETTTDSNGLFTFTNLAKGFYRIDQSYNGVVYNIYRFTMLESIDKYTINLPMLPSWVGSPTGSPGQGGSGIPGVSPIKIYDCKEASKPSKDGTIQIKYLKCTQSGTVVPKPT